MGAGKTTWLQAVEQRLQATARVAHIHHTEISAVELIETLCLQFALGHASSSSRESELRRFMAGQRATQQPVVIFADDAHRLPADTLLCLLQLMTPDSAPLLVIGCDASWWLARPQSPALSQLCGIVTGTLELQRFNDRQTADYIRHRLEVAGTAGRALFDAPALAEILRFTGGTPHLINRLCDSALTLAAARSCDLVGAEAIRDAARHLQWVEFSARPTAADTPATAADSSAELEVRTDGCAARRQTLRPGKLIIGRDRDSDMQLESRFVSRRHCRIITTRMHSYIEDLGSTNGLLVNGQRLRIHRLATRDRIVIGNYTLTYYAAPVGARPT
jgi:type II secretory pathway predicted ATPase ExeA